MKNTKSNITFEVARKLAVINPAMAGAWGKTQSLELNVVSWNGKPARFDIRGWSWDAPEFQAGKGISLSLEDATNLATALADALTDEKVCALVQERREEPKPVEKTAKKADLVVELEEQRKINAQMMAMMTEMAKRLDTMSGVKDAEATVPSQA